MHLLNANSPHIISSQAVNNGPKLEIECILATCIRNEGPYILEWFCHHSLLGFKTFIVYSNDNTDGSDELLQAMHECALIDWRPRSLAPGSSPQLTAYQHLSSELFQTDHSNQRYLLWLDTDEFLVLKNHASISELIHDLDYPDGISLNWKHFGSSGLEKYDPRLTIERFLLASSSSELNLLMKTVSKVDRSLYSRINNHRPEVRKGVIPRILYATEDRSTLVPLEIIQGADPRAVDTALIAHSICQLNHYSIRSKQEFAWKSVRGNGRLPVSEQRVDFKQSYFTARDLNHEIDDFAFHKYTHLLKRFLLTLPESVREISSRLCNQISASPHLQSSSMSTSGVVNVKVKYIPVQSRNLLRFKLDRDIYSAPANARRGLTIGGVAVTAADNLARILLVDQHKRTLDAKLGLSSPAMARVFPNAANSKLARFAIPDAPLQVFSAPEIVLELTDGTRHSVASLQITPPSNAADTTCLPRFSHQLDFLFMAETIRERIKGRDIIYIANRGNYGDALIRYGTLQFLRQFGFAFQEYRKEQLLSRNLSANTDYKNKVCLYGGSGAWCHVTPGAKAIVGQLSALFDSVIVLPSTYEIKPTYSENVLFWARGGNESFRNSSGFFCHDMAFMIAPIPCREGVGDGYFYRTDSEKSGRTVLPPSNFDLSASGNNYSNPFGFFDCLAPYSRIYTDRLHVAIAAALLGKTVHLTSSSYFKIREIYESSIRGFFDNVNFYES